jgi:DNA-binding NarL/FixJ family response regulator
LLVVPLAPPYASCVGVDWPLIGRAEELRLVHTLQHRRDRAAGVVLAGAPGVGKTRLALEALRVAAGRGALTRWVVATASARELPLGALAPLVEPVGADPARVLREAAAALRAGAGPAGVVLAVDDAHLLDELSAVVVHQLVLGRSATVVVTLRTGEPAPDAVTALWKDGHLQRLEVQPLSGDETGELLAAVLGGPVDAGTARRLWTITGGNALYLRQLVEGERDAGRLAEAAGVWRWTGTPRLSPGLTELVQERIGALSGAEREVVELLAFGEPLDVPLLVRLTGGDAVERVEARGLVQVSRDGPGLQARLAHPLYGEVQRARCGQLRARRLRGRIATALTATDERRGADVLRRAVLALDSDLPPDPTMFCAAASVAAGLTDLLTAERLARAAAAAGHGYPARLIVAQAVVAMGRPADVELTELAAHATSDPERLEAAVLRATSLLFAGRAADAAVVLDEAGAVLTGDHLVELTALRALVEAVLAHPATAVGLATDALARPALSVRATGFACWGLVAALGVLGRSNDLGAPAARARAAVGDAPEHAWMDLPVQGFRLIGLGFAGELAEADRLAADARRRYGDTPFGDELSTLLLGSSALAAGRVMTAARRLREARAGLVSFGVSGWSFLCLADLARALALTGDTEDARRAVAELESHPTYPIFGPTAVLAHAWIAAAEGAVSEAVALAHDAATLARRSGKRAVEVAALHDAVRLGDRGVAQRLAELACEVDGPRAPAAAAHAAALAADDAERLQAVSVRFEDMGALLHAADAAAHAAAAHGRHGRRGSAQAAAARASRLAGACEGAVTPALQVITRPLPLTDREREIVTLAAAGLSNRQIAERLVLSVRTVEGHVYRACTKLGVNERTALSHLLDSSSAAPPIPDPPRDPPG